MISKAELAVNTAMEDLSVFEFSKHPAFSIGSHEGYVNYSFGIRLGPELTGVAAALHEIAHAAEFGPKKFKSRSKLGSFVFKAPKRHYYRDYRGYTMSYENWIGTSALLREIKTCAIQYVLLSETPKKERLDVFFEEHVEALKYMPDFGNNGFTLDRIKSEFESEIKKVNLNKVLKDIQKWLDLTGLALSSAV